MSDDVVARNLSEEMVDMFLEDCIKTADVCGCKHCRADIRAYALNHLPPRYVVTTAGDIFVRVNSLTTQSQADIITAIVKAINVVSKNPRHAQEKSG